MNIVASGRFTDEQVRTSAQQMVERGKDADDIARATLASVDRSALYCLPIADGRWYWRFKQIAPVTFSKLIGRWGKRVLRAGH